MIRAHRVAAVLLACTVLGACGDAAGPNPRSIAFRGDDGRAYWPADTGWRRASAADVGLDPAPIEALVRRLRSNEVAKFHSLAIVRRGYLVTDEYFNGWSAEQLHTLQSDSKSVTSLLVGIAVDRGLLREGDRLLDLLPSYAPVQNADDRKRAIDVQDLLTMRTGMNWSEDNYASSPLFQLNSSRGDWVRFVIDWPMREAPGTVWDYNSGGVIALGGVLRAVTGVSPADWSDSVLFAPIGVTRKLWYISSFDRLPHLGGGLNLRPRDLARIGYLVLRRGRWETRQVVSERWLDQSTRPVARPRWQLGGSHDTEYGYLWWLLPARDGTPKTEWNDRIIAASGAGGQWLFVVPRHDIVVAITADTDDGGAAIRALYDAILPAVRISEP